MLLIVGLGNPTPEYDRTYHNIGFMAIEKLAEKLNKKIKKAECNALTSTFSVNGENIVLAKPMTYMNLSGEAVKGLMQKYGCKPEETIIIYDDFDLPKFSTRARKEGSAGTHNGMRNIVSLTGSTSIKRIRVGIGSTDEDKKVFVLSNLSNEDLKKYDEVFDKVGDAIVDYIKNGDFDALMRKVNC